MPFNEDSRVKIPTILHLTRLGYQYLSLNNTTWAEHTNIFPDIFKKSISAINPDLEDDNIDRLLEDIALTLDHDDLGKTFYEMLTERSGIKLLDLADFDNNSFHVVTELTYKNGDEEFRPDITLLINGMPLAFIEVKKPHNHDGVLVERKRINTRFQNKKFKRFANITQVMVFSNNMEYDDDSPLPIQGAFYATPSYDQVVFNYFREEDTLNLATLFREEDDDLENIVLKDNNLSVIKHSPEFITNKAPDRPTNRIATSLFSRDRLAFFLRYAIAYVAESDGPQKHIMRYPQFFATRAIERTLNNGISKGIIWHTQGSGKTALAYYAVHYLIDYFQSRAVIPKFYFIVDRIDLLTQAHREFAARGLLVHTVSSRDEFARDIKATRVYHNLSGRPEITVVNIQKFENDPNVVTSQDYDVDIQRVYFLDEVHRSYNPTGSFLANLSQSDTNAVKIGLTGTPLLGDDYSSKSLFGDYIHKYYYNASIADGYTLRLIREEIETKYKMVLQEVLNEVELLKGDAQKKTVYAHHSFVEPMLDYIVEDFEKSRTLLADPTIGGMVICDSADQAREMFKIFTAKYALTEEQAAQETPFNASIASEASPAYREQLYSEQLKQANRVTTAALILHDAGTKTERKNQVEEFKAGKIDFLFVYNMLLTGFDAKRLKKLYLGRVIKKHNLLQALTRVNRTYKEHRYGYVVDFADIQKEFDATNKAYFKELQSVLGDEEEHYSDLFKSKEEIEQEIQQINEALLHFDTENAEVFSLQIGQIQDRHHVRAIKKVLADARSLYNLIRLYGHFDQLDKLDFRKINSLYTVVANHLDMLNLKDRLENDADTTNLLNVALEDVLFMFAKVKEEELIIADKLKDTLRKTREAMAANFDKQDPEFTTLKQELERLFKKKKLNEVSQDQMNANIGSLNEILAKVSELNRQNNLLRDKYQNDPKYARIHKRLLERKDISELESRIIAALQAVKQDADDQVLHNSEILNNESYFDQMIMPLVIQHFKNEQKIPLNVETSKYINGLVVTEYMNEFNGATA